MPELSSSPSNSSIADRKTSDQIPPEQPSPIRALYKTEDELRELAASVARGDELALPAICLSNMMSDCLKTVS